MSLPLAALALLVVFGAVVAAGLPLAVGGGAVVVALALIWVVAGLTQMSIFVLNLATLLGLGLGVDYSLLMTSRFREELGRRRTADRSGADAVAEAVAVTVMTAGRAVFFSGLTVLLGLTGLILFEFPILRSVGIAGAIVVGLAVTAALTLLPAILSVLGDRIDAGRIRQVNASEDVDGPWARLARRVMRHPVAVFIPTLGFLLLLGAPFLHVRFNAPDATILPPDVPSRAAFDRLDAKFGAGRFAPLSLAIRTTGPATSAANVAALYDYSRRLAADPRIVRVDGFVDVDPRLTRDQYLLLYGAPTGPPDRFVATVLAATTKADLTTFTLTTPYGPNADEARRLVADLRASGGPLAAPATMTVLVGGGAADVVDVVDGIGAGFARTALFIFVSTYLVLFVLLRSVVLPAKALVMNTLSIVAAFGALVWIFQDGNLSALLGFQPLGYVETTQPVILFCILFGLSMDYEVFLLSRMKEVWDRTGDNTEAVARGLERSGRIVTSAALIVVVVAGSFAFADIVLIKALGLGDRDLGGARRDGRPGVARAGDDAPARATGTGGCRPGSSAGSRPAAARPEAEIEATPVTRDRTAALAFLVLAAPSSSAPAAAPVLANPTARRGPVPPAVTPRPAPRDPQPIALPARRCAARPADRVVVLHRPPARRRRAGATASSSSIFRAERGGFPVTWASHLAITDETGQPFHYAQRTSSAPRSTLAQTLRRPDRLRPRDLRRSTRTCRRRAIAAGRWAARRRGPAHARARRRRGRAAAAPGGLGLDLQLDPHEAGGPPRQRRLDRLRPGRRLLLLLTHARWRPPARSRWTAARSTSTGTAWFDHQWGDFISVGGGGWDWFAVELDDGTDLMLSLVRTPTAAYPLVYGTLVDARGAARHLDRTAFRVTPTGTWHGPDRGGLSGGLDDRRSPTSNLRIELQPTVPTRSSTRERPPASSTGRARRSSTPPGTASPSAARPTWS